MRSNTKTERGATINSNSALILDGNGALRVTSHEFAIAAGASDFTFQTRFQAAPGEPPKGYLVAKTNSLGNVRHFGVYVSASGRITIYTTTGADFTQLRSRFEAPSLTDGGVHSILIRIIRGIVLSLVVDGKTMPDVVLPAPLSDCGGATSMCVLYVGQRSSATGNGAFRFNGTIFSSKMFPSDALPSDATTSTTAAATSTATTSTAPTTLGKGK